MLINRKILTIFLLASIACNTVDVPINAGNYIRDIGNNQNVYYDNNTDTINSNRIIVSLGDSYSSGEGIEPFYGQLKANLTDTGDYFGLYKESDKAATDKKVKEEDWLAHRSQYAWSGMLTLPGVEGNMAENRSTNWFFVASSSAETKHIINTKQEKSYNISGYKDTVKLDPQLKIFDSEQLKNKKIDYVTMTIGGNDVGFSKIVTSMALESSYLKHGFTDIFLYTAYRKIKPDGKTYKDLKKTYQEIEKKVGKDTTIIVAGYPNLFEPSDLISKCIIDNIEAKRVTKAVNDFNNVIEEIVNNCRNSGMNIHFADVMPEFEGHGAYSKDPYINGIMYKQSEDISQSLKDVASAYSVHPNLKGSVAYAKCVQAKIDELEEKKHNIGDGIDPGYKKAYLEVLQQNKKEMNNYNWQYRDNASAYPVSLYDICGDGTPELFFITAQAPDTAADLHVYTYQNNEAVEIYTCFIDSTAGSGNMGFLLFSTSFARNLFLFSGYSDSFGTVAYKKLVYDGTKLTEVPFISIDTPESGFGSKEYKYKDDSVSQGDYDRVEKNLLYCLKDVVICDDDFTLHVTGIKDLTLGNSKNVSMSYDDIVLKLNDGQPFEAESQFKGISFDSDDEYRYKMLLDDLYLLAKAGTEENENYLNLLKETNNNYNMGYGDAVIYTLDNLGYCYGNIDGNETDELLVVFKGELVSIFTSDCDEIKNLVNSGYRDKKSILSDGSLYGVNTTSAFSTNYTHWMFNVNNKSFEVSERYFYDYFDEAQKDGFNNDKPWERDEYWYYTKEDTFDKSDCQKATYKDYEVFNEYYMSKKVDIVYKPFREWNYEQDNNIEWRQAYIDYMNQKNSNLGCRRSGIITVDIYMILIRTGYLN